MRSGARRRRREWEENGEWDEEEEENAGWGEEERMGSGMRRMGNGEENDVWGGETGQGG